MSACPGLSRAGPSTGPRRCAEATRGPPSGTGAPYARTRRRYNAALRTKRAKFRLSAPKGFQMAATQRPADRPRPVYLDLFAIRKPIPAIVSILHRASGALLFLVGIPALLWGVQSSLAAPEAYASFRAFVGHPLVKLALLLLTWAYLHHLLAGFRHLMQDLHVGLELGPARRSASSVFVAALLLTLIVGIRLW